MNPNTDKQVSLAGMAGRSARPAGHAVRRVPRRKIKIPWWAIVAVVAVIVLIIVLVGVFSGDKKTGPTLSARELTGYTLTPDKLCEKVSYYLVGVTGDDPQDTMDMLAVLCFDRKADTATLLQIPVATYIGDGEEHTVAKIGNVWGTPKSYDWCTVCRKAIPAKEIKDGAHTVCGGKTETRPGSSVSELAGIINKQYGLPVDNYLIIPRAGLAQLIDEVGGLDLKLSDKITVDDVEYLAGTRVLPGKAAVYYATTFGYDGTPASDIARMKRQRELLAGLISRLSRYKVSELYNDDWRKDDILSTVMNGASPIRMDNSELGKARLLGERNDSSTQNDKYNSVLAKFIQRLCKVELSAFTCHILPGEPAAKGTMALYSAHRTETINLLKETMNPYDLTLDDKTVGLEEISRKKKSDVATATLDTVLVVQSEPAQTE